MTRRHALQVNGWARTMETPLRIGKLLSVTEGNLGVRYWTIRFQGEGAPVTLIEGMLEAVQSAYAP